jgi:hypothetical protein
VRRTRRGDRLSCEKIRGRRIPDVDHRRAPGGGAPRRVHVRRGCLARALLSTKPRCAPRRCAPVPRPGGATTCGALFWFSVGAGPLAPNNRLQWMRGRACFRPEESSCARPRPTDPCVVRRRRDRLRSGAPGAATGCRARASRPTHPWHASPPRTRRRSTSASARAARLPRASRWKGQASGAPRRCAPAPRPGGATTSGALFWLGVGGWPPGA